MPVNGSKVRKLYVVDFISTLKTDPVKAYVEAYNKQEAMLLVDSRCSVVKILSITHIVPRKVFSIK